jgi:hypothetical protein
MTRPRTALGFAAVGLVMVAATIPVAATGRVDAVERWVLASINGLPDVVCGAGVGLLLGGVLTWIVGVPTPGVASRSREVRS